MLIYCKKCEAPNEDTARICVGCGASIRGKDDYEISPKDLNPSLERQIYRAALKALLMAGFIFACVGGCMAVCNQILQNEQAASARAFELLKQNYGR